MVAAVFRIAALALLCVGCTTVQFTQRSFEGTEWRIAAINGEATPSSGVYPMRFQGGRVSVGLGCNGGSGDYRVVGDQLKVAPLAKTERECTPIHRMELEAGAIRILLLPMQISQNQRTGGTILANSAGSLELVPVVIGKRL